MEAKEIINIAFIIYQRNAADSELLIKCLKSIFLPDSYRAEIVTVTGDGGYGMAYNAGMRKSQAKYKFYISENTRIIDSEWIVRVINTFVSNPAVAMIGVSGSKTIASDGVYVRNSKRLGHIKVDGIDLIWSKCPEGKYENALAIDSGCFATQYDISIDEKYSDEFLIGAVKAFDFRRRNLLSVVIGSSKCPIEYLKKDILVDGGELRRFKHDYLCNLKSLDLRRCACCGSVIEDYMPLRLYYTFENIKYDVPYREGEMCNVRHYQCPVCNASDRDRAYALWMRRNINSETTMRVLDVAPSGPLSAFIKREFPKSDYKSADLFMEGVDYKIDVMNMDAIQTASVDFFISSHVLEHVVDDIKAMSEFKRILNLKGCGIMVVPIVLGQEDIDEDPNCDNIAERWRRFGQNDHVRSYSHDGFVSRLKSVGLVVEEYGKEYFGDKEMYENALSDTSIVYVVRPA